MDLDDVGIHHRYNLDMMHIVLGSLDHLEGLIGGIEGSASDSQTRGVSCHILNQCEIARHVLPLPLVHADAAPTTPG